MKTNRAPWDYRKLVVVKPQLVKLCKVCAANFALHPDGVQRCMSCRCLEFVELYEHQAATFRRGLMEKQEEAARWLALDCLPQMDVVLELIGAALNMTPEKEAEMNRWIEEEISFTLSNSEQPDEGTDNRASTQWREHGYY